MTDLEARMSAPALKIKAQDIFLFNAKALQTPGVINMTVGEPDFRTPEHIRMAAQKAIEQEPIHYTLPQGSAQLTQAIADYLEDKYQLHYNPHTQIVTTIGVTEGIFTTFKSLLNPGDEVLLPTPCFTIYEPDIRVNGGEPVIIDTSQTGFRLDPEVLRQTLQEHPHAKAILLNYPNNPTGLTYTPEQLHALVAVLQQYKIFVISDEIYSELIYDSQHVSMAQLLPEQTILLNGLSKSHSMTGWRVGYICGPQVIMEHILHVHELLTTSISAVSQMAAIEALTHGQNDAEQMRQEYQRRRDFLVPKLNEIGFSTQMPQGAFYAFAKIPAELNQDDVQLANDLIKQVQLAVLPGSFFGAGGSGYLRISYAASLDNIQQTVTRLANYYQQHAHKG